MSEENWLCVASFKSETVRCHVTVYRDLSKGWARYRLEFGALYVKEGDLTRPIRYLSVRTKKTSAVTFTIVQPAADTMQALVTQAELFIIEDIEKQELERVVNRDVKPESSEHRKTGKTERERSKRRGK